MQKNFQEKFLPADISNDKSWPTSPKLRGLSDIFSTRSCQVGKSVMPQGCGMQAYMDVFTASFGTYHQILLLKSCFDLT